MAMHKNGMKKNEKFPMNYQTFKKQIINLQARRYNYDAIERTL